MRTIYISNYKRKLVILTAVVLFWIVILISAGILIDATINYTISLNNRISFTYSDHISVSQIYAKDPASAPYLQASNSNYKNFIDFKSEQENFKFSYPSVFEIHQQEFPGSEILYHIDFQNKKDKTILGFVQVWNLPYSLERFLESSKENSLAEFIEFSSEKIHVNNLDGYLWNYTIKSPNGNYKSLEAFFQKDSKLYRISYFIPAGKYIKNDYDIFWKMVNSFKVG